MDAEELDREWSAWLEERKRPLPPDPEFTRRVMQAVRAQGSPRAGSVSSGSSVRSTWPDRIRALLSPRPVLAFATLALAAGLAIRFLTVGPGPEGGGTRIKGKSFSVGYLLKRGERIVPAASGDGFRPGDRLQAIYSADQAGHIRFFSIDAAGRIECLSCAGADSISPAGQDKTFPFALELDADPMDEALVGIWTPGPAAAGSMQSWLRDAWVRSSEGFPGLERDLSRSAPSGTRVSFFLLRKKAGI
jgi:hypothetical protein